jgi:hypothetical protein
VPLIVHGIALTSGAVLISETFGRIIYRPNSPRNRNAMHVNLAVFSERMIVTRSAHLIGDLAICRFAELHDDIRMSHKFTHSRHQNTPPRILPPPVGFSSPHLRQVRRIRVMGQ